MNGDIIEIGKYMQKGILKMKKIIGFILMVAIMANIAPTTIFATDDDIDDNFSSVLSVLDKEITVNIIENEATVYAVYYDGETLAKVQSFAAKTGEQTFTADFVPDAVYIWNSDMEALSIPWRNEDNTTFAVLMKPVSATSDTIKVLCEGEEQELFIGEETKRDADLVAGDVVFLRINNEGMATEVLRAFKANDAGFSNYNTLVINGLKDDFNKYVVNPVASPSPFTTIWNPTDRDRVKLIYAPIITRNGRNYLVQVDSSQKTYIGKEATKDATVLEGATLDIVITDYTNVYVYDYNAGRSDRFYVGSKGDIYGTQVDRITTLEGEYYTVDWTKLETDDIVNFAFAKIVDDIVTDIFIIFGKEE